MKNQTKTKDLRAAALIRFGSAITFLTIIGHLYLGFEHSYLHVFLALVTGYTLELLFEFLNAKNEKRAPAYQGGIKNFILFLLPAHITSLAVAMLIFTNERYMGVVFGVTVAIISKQLFRVEFNGKTRHFLNPSNFGISVAYIVFPWIGAAPPYQFTENTSGVIDWIIPAILFTLGSILNYKFTKKYPLIISWLVFFALQAITRHFIQGSELSASLGVMTGVAFVLYTFYMISDPSTTPVKIKNQVAFGAAVAIVYGLLMSFHVVFGLFFSLTIVTFLRGVLLYIMNWKRIKRESKVSEYQALESPQVL